MEQRTQYRTNYRAVMHADIKIHTFTHSLHLRKLWNQCRANYRAAINSSNKSPYSDSIFYG